MNEYLDLLSPEMIENLFLATNKETKTQKIDINNNNNIARNKYCYEGSSSLSSESDLHKVAIEWYKSEKDSIFMHEFVIYIVNNYSNFKTKK